MLSRLSLRSASLAKVLARPDVQRQVTLAVARGCSSQTPLTKHLENWEKANATYYGPERDTKNFPHPVQPEKCPPTRMGMIPETWFTAIGAKTGVTGPYMLGFGVLAFLFSKEIWVVEHGFTEFVSFWIAIGLITKKYGHKMGVYFDNMTDQMKEKHWVQPLENTKSSAKQAIADMDKAVWQEDGQKHIFEAKRENVDLQLEAAYRQRLADVHAAVKKRLDYQVVTEQAKRRFEQEHMVNWIVGEVVKGITPQQEKESLNQCIKNLKDLSTRTAAA